MARVCTMMMPTMIAPLKIRIHATIENSFSPMLLVVRKYRITQCSRVAKIHWCTHVVFHRFFGGTGLG